MLGALLQINTTKQLSAFEESGYHSMIASLGHANPDRTKPVRTLVKEAFPVAGLNGLKTNTKNSRKILNDYERSFFC